MEPFPFNFARYRPCLVHGPVGCLFNASMYQCASYNILAFTSQDALNAIVFLFYYFLENTLYIPLACNCIPTVGDLEPKYRLSDGTGKTIVAMVLPVVQYIHVQRS
jgi:hypothetical protein